MNVPDLSGGEFHPRVGIISNGPEGELEETLVLGCRQGTIAMRGRNSRKNVLRKCPFNAQRHQIEMFNGD